MNVPRKFCSHFPASAATTGPSDKIAQPSAIRSPTTPARRDILDPNPRRLLPTGLARCADRCSPGPLQAASLPAKARVDHLATATGLVAWAPPAPQRTKLHPKQRLRRRKFLVHKDPTVDQLLLDPLPAGVEPEVLKVLSELEVDVVHAAAVLLDTDDHPVVKLLGIARVVHQMMPGHHVELVVEDKHDVSLVGQSRRSA